MAVGMLMPVAGAPVCQIDPAVLIKARIRLISAYS